MNRKVEDIVLDLAEKIRSWNSVDTVTVAEFADAEVTDPYFFISLDIYYRGDVPDPEERMGFFDQAGGFESSRTSNKDRFFIDGLPVRLELKNMSQIDNILENPEEYLWSSARWWLKRESVGVEISSCF